MLRYIILLVALCTLQFTVHVNSAMVTSQCKINTNVEKNSFTSNVYCERFYTSDKYVVAPLVQSHQTIFVVNKEKNGLVNRTVITHVMDYNNKGVIKEWFDNDVFTVILL